MVLNVNNQIFKISLNHFEGMLDAGCFPEVKWERTTNFRSYSLFEFQISFAKFNKILDDRIKAQLNDPLGIFTRKRNAKLMEQVSQIVANITETDVHNQIERFRTMMD